MTGVSAMNGTFAVLTFALGMYDAHTGCDSGCLSRVEADARVNVSSGVVHFVGDLVGDEIYVRYDAPMANGPFQLVAGVSATSTGDFWAGVGHTYTMETGSEGIFAELHAMTGIYMRGNGPELGGPIEFRSGVEIGYKWSNGWRAGLSLDHRSNAEIYASNPGVETVQFRVSMPLD